MNRNLVQIRIDLVLEVLELDKLFFGEGYLLVRHLRTETQDLVRHLGACAQSLVQWVSLNGILFVFLERFTQDLRLLGRPTFASGGRGDIILLLLHLHDQFAVLGIIFC